MNARLTIDDEQLFHTCWATFQMRSAFASLLLYICNNSLCRFDIAGNICRSNKFVYGPCGAWCSSFHPRTSNSFCSHENSLVFCTPSISYKILLYFCLLYKIHPLKCLSCRTSLNNVIINVVCYHCPWHSTLTQLRGLQNVWGARCRIGLLLGSARCLKILCCAF
jgi:hypothetical protein